MAKKRKPQHKRKSNNQAGGSPKRVEPLIADFLGQNPGRGYQIKQILKGLGVRDVKSKKLVTDAIFRLEDIGSIKKTAQRLIRDGRDRHEDYDRSCR